MNQKKMKTGQKEKNDLNKSGLFIAAVYIALILGAILIGYIRNYEFVKNLVNIVTSVVCAMLVQCFYSHNNGEYVKEIHSKILYIFTIIFSFVLIFVYEYEFIGCLWLISAAVISVTDGMKHGMVCYFLCMVQYILFTSDYTQNNRILLVYLLLGGVMVLMLSENTMHDLIYSVIAMTLLSGVFIIIRFGFDIKAIMEGKVYIIIQILSVLVIGLVTIIVKYAFDLIEKNNDVYEDEILEKVLEADYELIRRLQTYSANLFIHSMRVSAMSMRVAKEMGYNVLLAKAGGMYHEIGRIKNDSDYIEATKDIAYAYDFPKSLTELILQNCGKQKRPQSKEAVVVMFSDSIVSMTEYFMKNDLQDKLSKEKIIQSIFTNRIKKGSLEECGMSREETDRIREIFESLYMDF